MYTHKFVLRYFFSESYKLGIPTNIQDITAIDEADGTEIGDYDMLLDMSATSTVVIMLLQPGQLWAPPSTLPTSAPLSVPEVHTAPKTEPTQGGAAATEGPVLASGTPNTNDTNDLQQKMRHWPYCSRL